MVLTIKLAPKKKGIEVHLFSQFANWRIGMRRNPDAKDGDVDARNNACCTPFQLCHRTFVFRDDCNSIDDDLHQ